MPGREQSWACVAHAADTNLPSAHGRAEPVRDTQLVASDAGRDSPQMEGKKAAEKSGLSENRGIWHEELVENKVRGKSWLDLLKSNIIQGGGKDSSGGEGAVLERGLPGR